MLFLSVWYTLHSCSNPSNVPCHIYDPSLLWSFSFHIQLNPLNHINQHTERFFFVQQLSYSRNNQWIGLDIRYFDSTSNARYVSSKSQMILWGTLCGVRHGARWEWRVGWVERKWDSKTTWNGFFIFPSHHPLLPNLAPWRVLYEDHLGQVKHWAVLVQLVVENVFARHRANLSTTI